MASIRLTKRIIRSKILLRLNSQKEEGREAKSRIIKNKLFRTLDFKKAKKILFYVSFEGEVNTEGMIKKALKLGKIIAVPVCQKNRMIKPCLLKENAELIKGPYGTLEPVGKKCLNSRDIDLVIVPGLGFDAYGNRLGRGKGYYDRFLKRLSHTTTSIGLAFDFQILPSIPTTKHDVAVKRVISA